MLSTEQKQQFNEILDELGKSLDISETQHNAAVKSYEAVGDWLSKSDSELALYKPVILPQGSFMLGTMIQPVKTNKEDDLDIDLVCKLTGKRAEWTQAHLKKAVGDRLKIHGVYKEILDDEGRRCWTLVYSDIAKYHMDILPSIVSDGYSVIMEKVFSENENTDFDKLAIRITDKEEPNYHTSPKTDEWLKSNPFGYSRWFFNRATLSQNRSFSVSESIKPVPKYQTQKLPLQRVVQILKRHRDMMFNGNEDKPISIIITTLASKAYNKEANIIEALQNVIERMSFFIEEKYSYKHQKTIKWVSNPVNVEENFADKWADNPKRQTNFYNWIAQVQKDVQQITQQKGIYLIQESFGKPFGKEMAAKTFSNYAETSRLLRESGNVKMAAQTGMLGSVGTVVKNHNFYGNEDK
jgi:Second Messenger Oligonucleotide or Dinucleotide Synthetase domain